MNRLVLMRLIELPACFSTPRYVIADFRAGKGLVQDGLDLLRTAVPAPGNRVV